MSGLTAAVRRGLLDRNPATHVELRRPDRPATAVWTAEQLATFLDTARTCRTHPLFFTMALTGMRRGEALGLRWHDVDLDAAAIRVEQQVVLVGDQVHVGAPKSASGRRSIAAPAALVEALRWHAARQRLDRLGTNRPWDADGLVFTTETGAMLHPAAVSREFSRIAAAAGLPVIRLHDLRHTSASLGLASGETLLEVSRRLGHSSITITADIYSHVAPVTAHDSAERLSQLVSRSPTPGHHRR